MRQGQSQQNRNRPRGRGGRNKGGNQLSRNMESNGPDVKIRGNATHIAEKYATLAHDAQSSGDMVAAENYLQHAEHYNRLIATVQAAQTAHREAGRVEENKRHQATADADNPQAGDSEKTTPRHVAAKEQPVPVEAVGGSGPQPVFDETPAEVAIKQPLINGSDGDESAAKPVEKPRRPRQTTRAPRKEAAKAESKTKAKVEPPAELPAFIVGDG